jgi:hypothetical protein
MTGRSWTSTIAATLAAAGLAVLALALLRPTQDNDTTQAVFGRKTQIVTIIIAVAATAALVVAAIFAGRMTAAGWLLALTYASLFPIGSLALLMIHRLTGGRWGEGLEPLLRPLSLATPLLLVFVIPVLVAAPTLFNWQHGFSGEVTHSVRLIYLNIPSYVARALIVLAGWSVFAYILPEPQAPSARLIAGLGLLFHGIAVTVIGFDWILVAQPEFVSTSFGASVAFTQLLAALALAAVLAPRNLPDLGALMLVVALGITYTDFMAVLVMWYGDVPAKVFWFADRLVEPWRALAVAAFVLASLMPIVLLVFARVRASPGALRFVGACCLAGLAVYQIWLLAPAFGAGIIATAAIALGAMAAFLTLLATARWPGRFVYRRSASHG